MHIVFDRESMLERVMPLLNTASNKGTNPAAEGILFEADLSGIVKMTTFDLEKGTFTQFECQVLEAGSCVIKAQKFAQTVRFMEADTVDMSVDDELNIYIVCGNAKAKTKGIPVENFNQISELTEKSGFSVSEKTLKKMFNKVSFAVGVNEQRPVLNGCFIQAKEEGLLLVGCDGFRIARCETSVEVVGIGGTADYQFILPGKSVNELEKLLDGEDEEKKVTIYMSKRSAVFVLENYTFFSKLIEGEYINFDNLINRNQKIVVVVERRDLIGSLERAALVTEETAKVNTASHVKLAIEEGVIKISAISIISSVNDEINCEHDGEDIVIAFNNKFLIECLKNCDSSLVKIYLSSPHSSINIVPADEDAENDLFMVLPVRMVE